MCWGYIVGWPTYISDGDGLVDRLCKPFQAPGAHVADCSKPVKTGEENSLVGVA